MNADKAWILDRSDAAMREALQRVPGAYFQVARETVDDPHDREAVLARLVELFALSVEKVKARADAAEARYVERRRTHLHVVPEDTPRAQEGR